MHYPIQQFQKDFFHQVVVQVEPNYFSWSAKEQERWRAKIPQPKLHQIERILLHQLLSIEVRSDKQQEAVVRKFTSKQYLLFNSTMLLFRGIGEDNVYLNEFLSETKTLLDFDTVYDYDYDDFQFQQAHLAKDNPNYREQPYYGSLYGTWIRLLMDGAFYYASIYCLPAYVNNHCEEVAYDKIQTLIPHRYVNGENHGKKCKGGFLWDQRIDANGLEEPLRVLESRSLQYRNERTDFLYELHDQEPLQQAFIVDEGDKHEPQLAMCLAT